MLGIKKVWQQVEDNQPRLPAAMEIELLHILVRLARRATRWFLRNHRLNLSCESLIAQYSQPTEALLTELPMLQKDQWRALWGGERDELTALGVELTLAERLAAPAFIFLIMCFFHSSIFSNVPFLPFSSFYFSLFVFLSLSSFISLIVILLPYIRLLHLSLLSFFYDL